MILSVTKISELAGLRRWYVRSDPPPLWVRVTVVLSGFAVTRAAIALILTAVGK